MTAPRICQLAMCTTDMARTVRRYIDGLGFIDSGAHVVSGKRVGELQELGDDVTALLWWLVGGEEMVQLELFRHSDPPIRRLPAEWLPSDLGWAGWSVAVGNLPATVERLRIGGVSVCDPTSEGGVLQTTFPAIPEIGVYVDIREEKDSSLILVQVLAHKSGWQASPCQFRTSNRARAFYIETLQFTCDTDLRAAKLSGTASIGQDSVVSFVARGRGDVLLHVVEHSDNSRAPPALRRPPE